MATPSSEPAATLWACRPSSRFFARHRPAYREQELSRDRVDRELEGERRHRLSLRDARPDCRVGGSIRKPSRRCSRTSFEAGLCFVETEARHALHPGTQGADADAHRRERPASLQPERLRRGLDRRDHGRRRPHPRRLLQAFLRQGGRLPGGGPAIRLRRAAGGLAGAAHRSLRQGRRARPHDRRGLPVARSFRRPRRLVPDDRPPLRRLAGKRRR